jgi:hypothetical protein
MPPPQDNFKVSVSSLLQRLDGFSGFCVGKRGGAAAKVDQIFPACV